MIRNNEPSTLAAITPSALWVILMINLAGYIDGMHRLQKYAFILCKTIKNIDKVGLYKDWTAGEYGPYSQKLRDDIELLKKEGIIQIEEIENDFGTKIERYTTNIANKHVVERLENNSSEREYKQVESVFKKIIQEYSNKPAIELLYDIYSKFPQYAVRSTKRVVS